MTRPVECFGLTFSEDATLPMHVRQVGDVEAKFDWTAIGATKRAPQVQKYAQDLWSYRAYTEFCSASLLAQLGQAFAACAAPVNLIGAAFQLCGQELRHAEVCGRVAAALGGVSHLPMNGADMRAPVDVDLAERQVANQLALQLCCIGETVSLRHLQALGRHCVEPELKRVLQSIVKDEALHSRVGWLYYEWASAELTLSERTRLADIARHNLTALSERYTVPSALTASELHSCGDIDQHERVASFNLAYRRDIVPRLERLGIVL